MKVTVLGCGSAGGVPLIGNVWGNCDPNNPKNRRTRPSVLVEEGETTLLIDTSPDMRQQLLNCNLKHLTAVLYTHGHADHCHGIDDLRSVNWLVGRKIPIFADPQAMEEIQFRFNYIFGRAPGDKRMTRPFLEPHVVEGAISFKGLDVTPIPQTHGNSHSTGYRINDFAYSTDVSAIDDENFTKLKNLKVWIVGCVRERQHPTHASLDTVLEWVERLKPERAYLTHMDHSMDYDSLMGKLPNGVEPAYDGLVVTC